MAGFHFQALSKIGRHLRPRSISSHAQAVGSEEGLQRYCRGGFHPVRLGEVYDSRYEVLRKLGYGQYSTVWLVRNVSTHTFWAMKVLSAECYGAGADTFELEILQRLRSQGSALPGAQHITMLEDSFEHDGPNGRHVCLIFKVMGESMSTFQRSFPRAQIPSPLVKTVLQVLRLNMWPDIQPGNIMLHNPDAAALTTYLEETYSTTPTVQLASGEYQIVRSQSLRQHYIGDTFGFNLMTLEVSLTDWGVASWTSRRLSETIQPRLLRAPEVILEAPWGPAVDVWNLGALLPELIFGQNMFSGEDSGQYTVTGHLAEVNTLLGPFPRRLISESKLAGVEDMFDGCGNVRKYRMRKAVALSTRFGEMPDEEAPKFEAFTRSLLAIDPQLRASASKALEESWLAHEYVLGIAVEKVS